MSARDIPSLKTGNAVYVQLVQNMRKWIPGVIIERVSAGSYKVKIVKSGVYIRNRKFIRIKYTDLRQNLQATKEDRAPSYSNIHTERPKKIT